MDRERQVEGALNILGVLQDELHQRQQRRRRDSNSTYPTEVVTATSTCAALQNAI